MVAFTEIRKLISIVFVLTVFSHHTYGPPLSHPVWKYYKIYLKLSVYVDTSMSSSDHVYFQSILLLPMFGPLDNLKAGFNDTLIYPPPMPDLEMTCVDWLLFYGFTANDPQKNWLMAIHRDMRNDKYMHEDASDYAQFLDYSYYKYSIKPSTYCRIRKVPFRLGRETRKSCEEYILEHYYFPYDLQFNMNKALRRDVAYDGKLNECAAGYGQFLASLTEKRITEAIKPSLYCLRRLEGPEHLMHDIPLNEVYKPCHGWILHYGYTIDNLAYNIKLAKTRDRNLDNTISEWAAVYAERIHYDSYYNLENYLPVHFCNIFYKMSENLEVKFKIFDENSRPKIVVFKDNKDTDAASISSASTSSASTSSASTSSASTSPVAATN